MSVLLASASYDSTIKFWDALSGACSRTIQVDYSVNRLEITNDKRLLAAGGPPIKLYDISRSKVNPIGSYDSQGTVTALTFCANNNWLATSSEDGTIKIWDVRFPKCERQIDNGCPVNDLVIHPNQGEVFFCDRDGYVKVWDLGENKIGTMMRADESNPVSLTSISIASNAQVLVASSKKGDVYMWGPDRGNKTQQSSVASSPASTESYSSSWTPVTNIKAHDSYITRILLSSDAKHLATCSADRTAKIWDTRDLSLEATLGDPHKRWVWDCAFSADSAYLVTACSDNSVRLWDLATNDVVKTYMHSKPVTCCALNDI